jgi:hypothetical protein
MCRLLAVVVVLLAAPALRATVLLPAEFREIVGGSKIIAHVRIVDIRPEWAEGRRRIDSVVTATVVTSFKGESGDALAFKIPGGELGRYRSVMVGAPVFHEGDEAVLFLDGSNGTPLHVFGLNQGVFRVRMDPVSGQRIVVPPILMARGALPEPVVRGAATRRSLGLDAFGAQVRSVMAQLRGAQQ